MKALLVVRPLVVSLAVVALASAARGQATSESAAVSGMGTVVLKRKPETLRMFVDISAKGKSLKEALEKLKERREAAEKKLAELGADKASIKAESPRIPPVDMNRQRQLERMVRERMRDRGKRPGKRQESQPATVVASLSADFALSADDTEGLLLASGALQEQIRKADLAGAKDNEEPSPEEEEMQEEMAEMSGFDDGSQARPGEPNFLFVAKISPEERSKALADAFAKAKAQAAQVAAAAGAKLGDLRRVAANSSAGRGGFENYASSSFYEYPQAYQPAFQRFAQRVEQMNSDDATDSAAKEAFGLQAGDVQMPIIVTAEFSLK